MAEYTAANLDVQSDVALHSQKHYNVMYYRRPNSSWTNGRCDQCPSEEEDLQLSENLSHVIETAGRKLTPNPKRKRKGHILALIDFILTVNPKRWGTNPKGLLWRRAGEQWSLNFEWWRVWTGFTVIICINLSFHCGNDETHAWKLYAGFEILTAISAGEG